MDGVDRVVFGLDRRQHGPAPAPSGVISGTWVETADGWRLIENLKPGALLHVHGGGLRPLEGLMPVPAPADLVHVPGGALDNCADLWLAKGQLVLIDTLDDPALPDALEVLVPAGALIGLRGVTGRPAPEAAVLWQITCAEEEVIWAQTGVPLHVPSRLRPETARQSCDFAQLPFLPAQRFLARRLARPVV